MLDTLKWDGKYNTFLLALILDQPYVHIMISIRLLHFLQVKLPLERKQKD